MTRASRMHRGDEFGKAGSSSISGFDPPMIGAGASITVDGITERESGVTPPPPPLTMRAILIGLVVMFAAGVTLLALLMQFGPKITR